MFFYFQKMWWKFKNFKKWTEQHPSEHLKNNGVYLATLRRSRICVLWRRKTFKLGCLPPQELSEFTMSAEWVPSDAYLTKRLSKMIHRIDRIIESNQTLQLNVSTRLGVLLKQVERGTYYADAKSVVTELKSGRKVSAKSSSVANNAATDVVAHKVVKWDELKKDIIEIISRDNPSIVIPEKILDEMNCEHNMHFEEESKLRAREKLRFLQQRNGQPIVSGKWRKEAYPSRTYEFLNEYAITTSVSEDEGEMLKEQLITPLNGFLGQAYNYDDHGLTEEWMVSFKDGSSSASDADIIRTQIESLLEIMLVQVVDRVCTGDGVLEREPLRLGVGAQIREMPVWGIDCYTRRMVELAIEDRVMPRSLRNEKAVKTFIEKRLLPAINAQPVGIAHNMLYALKSIHECEVPHSTYDVPYAFALIDALQEHGLELFRIHPKGTGVICTNPQGIAPHVMVSEYLGEIYPPYRWCERLDVVEQAQQTFGLKPALPDFYNILLERPRQDPGGYGLLYVDASQKANLGSSCSHSCNSNCTSAVVARNGRLVIVLTTSRHISLGEELTMDYYSITTSDVEWRAAICLCGQSACRGSFLHYATQDDLQQVLNQNCGPLWRYASLLRACTGRPLSEVDQGTLDRHGMRSAAIGRAPQPWLQKFAADNLRFVEFERKALPCALMRSSNGRRSLYSYSAADMDARSVMEQRLQAMVCCFSMVQRVLARQSSSLSTTTFSSSSFSSAHTHSKSTTSNTSAGHNKNGFQESGSEGPLPTRTVSAGEAAERVWRYMSAIPTLMEEHCLAKPTAPIEQISDKILKGDKPTAPTAFSIPSQHTSVAKRTSDEKKIVAAVTAIRAILIEKPRGITCLRKMVLALRAIVLTVADLQFPKARLGLLADILALWAHTSNFSCVQEYNPVESDSMPVVARELGNNISRIKILKPETRVIKRRGKEEVAVVPVAEDSEERSSAEDLSLLAEEAKQTEENEEEGAAGVEEEVEEDVEDEITYLMDEATSPIDAGSEFEVETEEVSFSESEGLTDCAADTPPICPGKASAADTRPYTFPVTDPSTHSVHTDSTADECSSEPVLAEFSRVTEGGVDLATNQLPIQSFQSEEVTMTDAITDHYSATDDKENKITYDTEDEIKMEIKTETKMEIQMEIQMEIEDEIKTFPDDNLTKVERNTKQAVPKEVNQFQQIMDPNEPVFMGSKKYGKLFVFWQLIGWFNAGSDQKIEAPDLYGCVQLPLPAACFGVSETPYGAKQREFLIAHLREEKAQSMPWPAVIKACFNTAHVSARVDGRSLLGSPMLDGALGQVDSVTKAMEYLSPQSSSSSSAASKNTKTDNSQFDSILPPEVPTSWVQCESCRKWRRVAWHVDGNTLPDLWECTMNHWEPENATCTAPQDSYDPERESTLAYTSSEVHNDEEALVIGSYRDVFCKKNKIYYEAQVKRLRIPKKATDKIKILFHFKGWSPKFDEWIEAGSDRISSHNLHTDPTTSDPRDQEKWQGVHGISGTTNIAATALKKKAEKEAEKIEKAKEKAIKDKADKALKNKKSAASRKRASLNAPKKVETSSYSGSSKRRRYSADAADEVEVVRDSQMCLGEPSASVSGYYGDVFVPPEEDLVSESPYYEEKICGGSAQDDAASDVSVNAPMTTLATDAERESDGDVWGDSYSNSQ